MDNSFALCLSSMLLFFDNGLVRIESFFFLLTG